MENEDVDNKTEMTDDDVSEMAKDEYLNNVVLDKVIKFIKTDDLIRKKNKEHREELKVLKQERIEQEEYLMLYLKEINQKNIDINCSTGITHLTISESKRKEQIKPENIKKAVISELYKEKLVKSENRVNKIIDDLFAMIEENRKVVVKPYLKRKTKKC